LKKLLTLTAIIEAATGLALIAVPAIVVRLLLGAEISGASIPLGRVAGAALLALGVACWLARDDTQSRTARGLVVAMLMYNIAATAILFSPASAWGCTEWRCGLRWFSTQRWPSGV
jgi:hypothetical protein